MKYELDEVVGNQKHGNGKNETNSGAVSADKMQVFPAAALNDPYYSEFLRFIKDYKKRHPKSRRGVEAIAHDYQSKNAVNEIPAKTMANRYHHQPNNARLRNQRLLTADNSCLVSINSRLPFSSLRTCVFSMGSDEQSQPLEISLCPIHTPWPTYGGTSGNRGTFSITRSKPTDRNRRFALG